ncbi:hypothetical protein HYV74_00500 [Candidatus Uhrbacteria bacterium]|nr:hypothetical protein [Candidatus Uhrbacteria bacterium]
MNANWKKPAVFVMLCSILLIAGSAWSLRSSIISKIHHHLASGDPKQAMVIAKEHSVLISQDAFHKLLATAIQTETSSRAWIGNHLAFAVTADAAQLPTATICGIVERALTRYADSRYTDRFSIGVLGGEAKTADALLHTISWCPTSPYHEAIVALRWLDGPSFDEQEFRERHPPTDAQILSILTWAESHNFLYPAIHLSHLYQNRVPPEVLRRIETRVADSELASAIGNHQKERIIELVTTRPISRTVPEISELTNQQFEQLLRDGKFREALSLAYRPKSGLTAEHRTRAATAWYDERLAEHDALGAYRVAAMYHLSPEHRRRAADAAFAAAEKSGRYTLARQLPDGTFMILQ